MRTVAQVKSPEKLRKYANTFASGMVMSDINLKVMGGANAE
jgi:hypothetical protein